MEETFAKYSGCGNDFLIFDNREQQFPIHPPLIQTLCHRQQGVGADGILLLESSSRADYRMRIFNPDGSEAEMCGNGLRCLIQWLIDQGKGIERSSFHIELPKQTLMASKKGDAIQIEMGAPREMEWDVSLPFKNYFLPLHFLHMGVPHVMMFVDSVEAAPLMELGPYLRSHPRWGPKGTNVNLVEKVAPQKLKIRTYERGVEGETLACGTGATAAAIAAAKTSHWHSPILVQTRSGEELSVDFSFDQESFSQVKLTGTARFIFQGKIKPDHLLKGLNKHVF